MMLLEWKLGFQQRKSEIVVRHALRFKDSINYFAGWKVESISFDFNESKAELHKPALGPAI